MGGILPARCNFTRIQVHSPVHIVALMIVVVSTFLCAHTTSAQVQRGDSAKTIVLTVLSTPPDADVLIDGIMQGRTPLQLSNLRPGMRELRVVKTGYCDFLDSLYVAGVALVRDVQLDSACGVSIASTPDSAAVYLDNVFAGKSPLKLMNLRTGWKSVKLVKPNWAIWETRIHLLPGNLVTINAPMQSKFGTLSLEVYAPGIAVSIDGHHIGTGPVVDYMIPSGRHDLGAWRENNRDSVIESIYIQPGETVHWEARFGVSSRKAFWLSLAVPGLGQVEHGSSFEGYAIMGGFLASGGLALVMDLKYASQTDKLGDLRTAYHAARTEDEAKSAGDAYVAHFNDMKTTRTIRNIGIVAAGVIYLYSLYDAFVNHATVNVISPILDQQDHTAATGALLNNSGSRVTFRIPL